jgi:uncharacterized membrane protein (UPF0127 family)
MILFLPIILSLATESFSMEVAKTPEEQRQGLMNRPTLGDNEGMIFEIPLLSRKIDGPCMWMQDTLISLDMLFISQDGKILDIIEKTGPKTLDARCPKNTNQKIARVIEVKGGTVARIGLKIGDKIKGF